MIRFLGMLTALSLDQVTTMKRLLLILGLTLFNIHAIANTPSLATQLQTYANTIHASQIVVGIDTPNQNPLIFTNQNASLAKPYYAIGSITKTFTASLITQLVQRNQLSLNTPVGQFFPQYPNWQKVTVQMLLNQTSGLPDYIDTPNFFVTQAEHPNHLYSATELLNLAYALNPTFAPGKGWAYSNTNYVLLGLIAQNVTGKSLATLYQAQILNPTQLTQTLYATSYYPKNFQTQLMPGFFDTYPATPTHMTWLQGAGGMVSTTQDLLHWGQAIYQQQAFGYFAKAQQNRVSLSNGQPTKDLSLPTYGWGIFSINTPYGMMWYTPGLVSGYRSVLAYLPCQGILITTVVNQGDSKMSSSTDLIRLTLKNITQDPKLMSAIHTYQTQQTLPAYCSLPKAKQLRFPLF